MKDKKFIVGGIIVLIITIAILLVVFLLGSGSSNGTQAGDPFADTNGTRPAMLDTNPQDPFAAVQDGWVPGAAVPVANTPMLRKISTDPVVGAVTYMKGGVTPEAYVRFVQRDTGFIMETPLARIAPISPLSQQTVLRLGEALWTPDAQSVLLRRLDETGEVIFTSLASFSTSSSSASTTPVQTNNAVHVRPLGTNIITAAFSPSGKTVFYIMPADTGTAGYLETVDDGTRAQVWTSPLKGLTTSWTTQDNIIVYTNPSSEGLGYVWLLDPKTWKSEVVLGNERALAAKFSPDGTHLLYSLMEQPAGIRSLRVLNTKTGDMAHMPIGSIVEKCAWGKLHPEYIYCASPRNLQTKGYLESWYRGDVSSVDTLWRVNVATGEAKRLIDPSEVTKTNFDMVDLDVSPDDKYLIMREKSTDSLWAVQLPEITGPAAPVATTTATTP